MSDKCNKTTAEFEASFEIVLPLWPCRATGVSEYLQNPAIHSAKDYPHKVEDAIRKKVRSMNIGAPHAARKKT